MNGVIYVILVIHTGHNDWPTREKATAALVFTLPESYPYLVWGTKYKDAEIAARCNSIISAHLYDKAKITAAKANPTKYPSLTPWIDMLPIMPYRQEIIDHYLDLARQKIGKGCAPDWKDYQLATKLYIHDLAWHKCWSVEQLVELLDEMADRQKNWINKNGHHHNPPPLPLK